MGRRLYEVPVFVPAFEKPVGNGNSTRKRPFDEDYVSPPTGRDSDVGTGERVVGLHVKERRRLSILKTFPVGAFRTFRRLCPGVETRLESPVRFLTDETLPVAVIVVAAGNRNGNVVVSRTDIGSPVYVDHGGGVSLSPEVEILHVPPRRPVMGATEVAEP